MMLSDCLFARDSMLLVVQGLTAVQQLLIRAHCSARGSVEFAHHEFSIAYKRGRGYLPGQQQSKQVQEAELVLSEGAWYQLLTHACCNGGVTNRR